MTYSKNHTQYHLRIASVLAALVVAVLACQIDIGGPKPPGPPISTQAAATNELTNAWHTAMASAASSGQVLVLINEIQLTSFLAQRMEAKENPTLLDPQVYLRQNSIQIYGITERGPFKASVLLAITPLVSPEGSISFELTTVEVGPIPAPRALKDSVSAILTEAFTGTLGSLATGIRVTSLAISDGEMAIVGELR